MKRILLIFTALLLSQFNYLLFSKTDFKEDIFSKIMTGPIVNDGMESSGSSWIDYDNDGFVDLFVANRSNYENNNL